MQSHTVPVFQVISFCHTAAVGWKWHIFLVGWSGQNLNFIKIIWFLQHLKTLNERISEWAHFLKLTKRFRRYLYLNFSAPKMGFFSQALEGNYLFEMAPKRRFLHIFCNFLGINTHNFVKTDPKFENKSLFYAKFSETWPVDMKKCSDPKGPIFEAWDLSLG